MNYALSSKEKKKSLGVEYNLYLIAPLPRYLESSTNFLHSLLLTYIYAKICIAVPLFTIQLYHSSIFPLLQSGNKGKKEGVLLLSPNSPAQNAAKVLLGLPKKTGQIEEGYTTTPAEDKMSIFSIVKTKNFSSVLHIHKM